MRFRLARLAALLALAALVAPAVPGSRLAVEAKRLTLAPGEPSSRLQAFLNAAADTLVIPPKRGGWVTGPLRLTRGDRVVILMPGTEIRAKPGAFLGDSDVLLLLEDLSNVGIVGYGARLVMHKPDYTEGEWRHAVSIRGSSGIRIEGLAIDSSGGDGIYIDGSRRRSYSQGVHVLHCVLTGHRRQGISVISVDDLLIEHTRAHDTRGTAPAAGIDFEPDRDEQRLTNCRVRNSVFSGNAGPPAAINLVRMSGKSLPVSITFEDCLLDGGDFGQATMVRAYRGSVTKGNILFKRTVFRNLVHPTLLLRATTRDSATIRFEESLFEGVKAGRFVATTRPLIQFNESRLVGNASGVMEAAVFDGVKMTAGSRPVLSFAPLEGAAARHIRIRGMLDPAAPRLRAHPGTVWEEAGTSLDWPPPPPAILEFRRRGSRTSVVLGTWSGDSVAYSVQGGAWKKARSGIALRMRPGEGLRALSWRDGMVSDTLSWKAPGL